MGFTLLRLTRQTIKVSRGWKIGFVVLSVKLGPIFSHAVHYFCLTKKFEKKKLARATDIKMRNVILPVVNPVPGVLQIPSLP